MTDAATDSALTERDKAFLAHLSELAADPGNRIYAVMDGAFFSDIGSDLRDAGITRRPLYRYGGNYSVVIGGPWLINPYRDNAAGNPDQDGNSPAWAQISEEERVSGKDDAKIYAERMNAALDAGDPTGGGMLPVDDVENISAVTTRLQTLLRIADGKPGLVLWIGEASLTEEDLYKHLRRLNKVEVPREQADSREMAAELSEAAASEDEIASPKQGEAYELVIFRHADANVMAQVFPALNDGQLARLFGPCHQLLFAPEPDWGGGVKRAKRPENLPAPPSGPFRWDRETMRAIGERRLDGHQRKITAYLRKVAPEYTGELDDAALACQVRQSTQEGLSLGIRSEAAHSRWAYLHLVTGGQIGKDAKVRSFMTSEKLHSSPDQRVRQLMRATIERLEGVN